MIMRARPEALADFASPPPRRPSFQLAIHPRENTASQSHRPPAQSLGAIHHTLPEIPLVLPIRVTSSGRHFLIASRESVDMMDRQPDLTLSLCTPSIQSYANVCSRQHRNRS